MTPNSGKDCAMIIATRIHQLRECNIQNIWIRLNELLDSESDFSRVLGFDYETLP